MTNDSPVFAMDSGPFRDVIPILLDYLDLKSRVQLAQTCRFWKYRIYIDLKRWPTTLELPYLGSMDNYVGIHHSLEEVVHAKLWSMVRPPEDPRALENVLKQIASSDDSAQRFSLVTKINFKNFIHTDESLRLTALLFPAIEEIRFEGNLLSINGIHHIAMQCQKLKHVEFYQCENVDLREAFRIFDSQEHQENLERIFVYRGFWRNLAGQIPLMEDLPFMAPCEKCGLYYNQLKNEQKMLCLYHPGVRIDTNEHSRSLFSCCGSNTPRYPSTLGCQYTFHTKCSSDSFRKLHDGLPEYMFQKYSDVKFSLRCYERRRLDKCYKRWNL
ncbi:unnamed protein product [Adineta ricciae]|uniref:F-box domain-containing protein n=1 Tax=Adineta ricciae TaxID=249248 RepID=A0A815J1P1_ADIRI|nr:unnamed protein product [Adineta ricciae]CAF1615186.1 unnamed protein product [Adineta ricciae]